MTKKLKSGGFLLLLLVIFLGMFAVFGPGVYNDSDQYIKMHIHREPLYPLFLAALRSLFGEGWLTAMGIIQNVLAAVSIWMFTEYVGRRFRLKLWEEAVVVLIALAPHMMTKYFSSLHLFMTNSVMSEALCLPLFTLFIMECLKLLEKAEKRKINIAAVRAIFLALMLSLIRNQMMLAILMWMIVLGAKILSGSKRLPEDGVGTVQTGLPSKAEKRLGMHCSKAVQLLIVIVITILVFVLRTLAVKSYNLVFNGHFINNTYGMVNTLTNILYASDREDGEGIEDREAKEFFYRMYDLMDERQANYKYAGDSLSEKTEHIEQWHDTIKYEMIEDVFYQTYDKTITSDYILQNLMADETAGKIIAGVLPGCFFRWAGNYLLIIRYGLIRSVAVVHPVINWAAAFVYTSAMGLMYILWKGHRRNGASVFMAVAMLSVLANAGAVSVTIMCLSRYMIYGFTPFYTAYFLLLREGYRYRASAV